LSPPDAGMNEPLLRVKNLRVEFSSSRGLLAPEAFAAIDALRAIAAEVGQALSRVAVAWLLHQPGVAAVVAGARDARQAADNAQAAEVELDDAVTRRLAEATETVKQIIGANADPWEHVSRMERP